MTPPKISMFLLVLLMFSNACIIEGRSLGNGTNSVKIMRELLVLYPKNKIKANGKKVITREAPEGPDPQHH